jgi:hypothetical protein
MCFTIFPKKNNRKMNKNDLAKLGMLALAIALGSTVGVTLGLMAYDKLSADKPSLTEPDSPKDKA